jgi:three-Cys-motif partner protein
MNIKLKEQSMTGTSFFDESKEQSQVKSTIVAKYFEAWARVMIGTQNRYRRHDNNRIAYIDLFAGPGRYSDGTTSTPLLVLQKAIQAEDMRQRLVTIFNDKDENNTNSLSEAITQLPDVNKLKHRPQVSTQEVGENIVKMFEEMKLVPTLFFVDPWGYKGLSLRLVNSVIKDWGCDCIFFFNYNRINMGLNNDAVREHMNALFGEERADELRARLSPLASEQRELTIVGELCHALRDLGPKYVLPFRFKDDHGSRTSHHLIFVSKGFKGYEIMKEIMAKESSDAEQGVAKFEYNPVDARMAPQQQLLFELSRPLDDLGDMLLKEFAGEKLTMRQIYELHNVNRPYTNKNYKQVLMQLEEQGKIASSPHRKGTFGDTVVVTFSDREGNSYG